MTSELECMKTNEIARRRKLRLQQVREQSKDIAKRIRQRAKVGSLQHLVQVDAAKEKEYFRHQDKLIKRLQDFYVKSLDNFGAGHRNATACDNKVIGTTEKIDLSKKRGREAAAELRRRQQEKIDSQKKSMDRILQAREIANAFSWEKSSKSMAVTSNNKIVNEVASNKETNAATSDVKQSEESKTSVDTNENVNSDVISDINGKSGPEPPLMEWEPHIPIVSLPILTNNKEQPKESPSKKCAPEISDKRRPDLFAISDEMPSTLRGGLTSVCEQTVQQPVKPALTMVSEYIQNRDLRLRNSTKTKQSNDLKVIRQTIQTTRASSEGSALNNIRHMVDKDVVRVPTSQAEINSGCIIKDVNSGRKSRTATKKNPVAIATSSLVDSSFEPNKKWGHDDPAPGSVLRRLNPSKRNLSLNTFKTLPSMSSKSCSMDFSKKNSVTTYNHATRDIQDIPCGDQPSVIRDSAAAEDAYSQAVKETNHSNKSIGQQKKLRESRHRIAMSKQTVDKEFADTMTFLNSLPKNDKPIKCAYKDERRQQLHKEYRQHKLQQEFKNIEKECKNHPNMISKPKTADHCRSTISDLDVDFNVRDLQYSWMPVPDSDRNMAVHTIPTSLKKSGNSVKFSSVDNYHEYRSRHKHTPPTKDSSSRDKTESVEGSDSSQYSSAESDICSEELLLVEKFIEKRQVQPKTTKEVTESTSKISDFSRIFHKILDSQRQKDINTKLLKELVKNVTSSEKERIIQTFIDESQVKEDKQTSEPRTLALEKTKSMPINKDTEKINYLDGDILDVTKSVVLNGDNITENRNSELKTDAKLIEVPSQSSYAIQNNDVNGIAIVDKVGGSFTNKAGQNCECKMPFVSAATSSPSLKTVTTEKAATLSEGIDGGFFKIMDTAVNEGGKFFVGATGYLKDEDYEVIVQLKKKTEANKNQEDLDTIKKGTEKVLATRNTQTENTKDSEENVNIQTKEARVGTDNVMIDSGTSCRADFSHAKSNTEVDKTQVATTKTQGTDCRPKDAVVMTSFCCSPRHVGIDTNIDFDSAPQQVATVCTQTTLDSPHERPVMYHMSSTSTAYMSPPELVMPPSLKHNAAQCNQEIIDGELYETDANTSGICRHACKVTVIKKSLSSDTSSKLNASPTSLQTPISFDKILRSRGNLNIISPRNVKSECKNFRQKNSCRKCKVNQQKSKDAFINKKSCSNDKIKKYLDVDKKNKQSVNPIVKWYVDKLLNLNREGMKAVEVLKQDCSSVSTPQSSIIEVSRNIVGHPKVETRISLEQIKQSLFQHIMGRSSSKETVQNINKKILKKKSMHKVKTLNISKKLCKVNNATSILKPVPKKTFKKGCKPKSPRKSSMTLRSKNSSLRKKYDIFTGMLLDASSDVENLKKKHVIEWMSYNEAATTRGQKRKTPPLATLKKKSHTKHKTQRHRNKHEIDSEPTVSSGRGIIDLPSSTSKFLQHTAETQTIQNSIEEINFLKVTENKLHNIEKIANLTDKCTQRLTNLAKVLKEVRNNKSREYGNNSDTTADSETPVDSLSNKRVSDSEEKYPKSSSQSLNSVVETREKVDNKSSTVSRKIDMNTTDCDECSQLINKTTKKSKLPCLESVQIESIDVHSKKKPPPALARKSLKNVEGPVVPHELSTVLEVDSPMSSKPKTSWKGKKSESPCSIRESYSSDMILNKSDKNIDVSVTRKVTSSEHNDNSDILKNNDNLILNSRSLENLKLQMMNLKQFNEIMFKPFISIQEFAKQCNLGTIEEGSIIEDVSNPTALNDDLISLHSDGSLPDVIAELLKRKLIKEPFKFDNVSNVHSTTVSSESTLSTLPLSKSRTGKEKGGNGFKNKENIAESSDISFSSNPDLENAFKKLGLGWASSTLKKTKERLALSSSSSSSSLSQLKLKSLRDHKVPVSTAEIMSSFQRSSRQEDNDNNSSSSRDIEPQIFVSNSMLVKNFLQNELAKKITFTNRSNRKQDEEAFVSLYDTKIPEEMKLSIGPDDKSFGSHRSNRARTSTPVRIHKPVSYQTSSSSNLSNGLFSNVDELSSVKGTSNSQSQRNYSTSDKDDLTIPNYSLRLPKSDNSKSD